jgi:hypothetical protein
VTASREARSGSHHPASRSLDFVIRPTFMAGICPGLGNLSTNRLIPLAPDGAAQVCNRPSAVGAKSRVPSLQETRPSRGASSHLPGTRPLIAVNSCAPFASSAFRVSGAPRACAGVTGVWSPVEARARSVRRRRPDLADTARPARHRRPQDRREDAWAACSSVIAGTS